MGLEDMTKGGSDDPYPSTSRTVELDLAPRQGAASWAAPRLTAPPRPCAPAVHHNSAAYPRPELAPVTWRERLFPEVTDDQWNDWKWQFRNRITTLAELERFFPLADEDRAAVRDVLHEFRMGI